jgi:hypothetical protein
MPSRDWQFLTDKWLDEYGYSEDEVITLSGPRSSGSREEDWDNLAIEHMCRTQEYDNGK